MHNDSATVDYIVNDTLCHDTHIGTVVKALLLKHTGLLRMHTDDGLLIAQYSSPQRMTIHKPHTAADAAYSRDTSLEVIHGINGVTHTDRFQCATTTSCTLDRHAAHITFRNGVDEAGQPVFEVKYRHPYRVLWRPLT